MRHDRGIDLDVADEPHADEARQREERHPQASHLGVASEQAEERNEEYRRRRPRGHVLPRRQQTPTHEVRFLAEVAVPDHEVLTEGEISPECREGETQLADVVEM